MIEVTDRPNPDCGIDSGRRADTPANAPEVTHTQRAGVLPVSRSAVVGDVGRAIAATWLIKREWAQSR